MRHYKPGDPDPYLLKMLYGSGSALNPQLLCYLQIKIFNSFFDTVRRYCRYLKRHLVCLRQIWCPYKKVLQKYLPGYLSSFPRYKPDLNTKSYGIVSYLSLGTYWPKSDEGGDEPRWLRLVGIRPNMTNGLSAMAIVCCSFFRSHAGMCIFTAGQYSWGERGGGGVMALSGLRVQKWSFTI